MITDWIRLHSVLLPLLITDLLYYLLCTFFSHPFIPVNAFLECCILFVCFFWFYYETCTSKLLTYFQFVSVVYFLYASFGCSAKNLHQHWSHISSLYLFYTFRTHPLTCCIQKEYIKINHIPCVYFLCMLQVYIR